MPLYSHFGLTFDHLIVRTSVFPVQLLLINVTLVFITVLLILYFYLLFMDTYVIRNQFSSNIRTYYCVREHMNLFHLANSLM